MYYNILTEEFHDHQKGQHVFIRERIDMLKKDLEEAIKKQQADNKIMLTSYVNSQIEIKAYLCTIMLFLFIFLVFFIHILFRFQSFICT